MKPINRYIIMKKGRLPANGVPKAKDAYRGSACESAGIESGFLYTQRKTAEVHAALLTEHNPVGFTVWDLGGIKCTCDEGYTRRLACEALGITYIELREIYWNYRDLIYRVHGVDEWRNLPSPVQTALNDVWALMYLPVLTKMNEIGRQHNPACICEGTGWIQESELDIDDEMD